MSWSNPNAPNLPDFTLFVTNAMGINPLYLPTNSPFIGYAFNRALNLVISAPCIAGNDYTLAVYNCGGHILITITPDQAGREYFVPLREKLGITRFSAGVVASSSDEATSASLAVPDALGQLTIGDLAFTKSLWGREYLAYAQDFGGLWGLS